LLKAKSGFEIYDDPTDDPDIGEVLVVKKQPSRVRGGLGGVRRLVAPLPMPMGVETKLGVRRRGLVG